MINPSEAFSTGMTEAGYWNSRMAGRSVTECPITGVKDERDALPARVQVSTGIADGIKGILKREAKFSNDARPFSNQFEKLVLLTLEDQNFNVAKYRPRPWRTVAS